MIFSAFSGTILTKSWVVSLRKDIITDTRYWPIFLRDTGIFVFDFGIWDNQGYWIVGHWYCSWPTWPNGFAKCNTEQSDKLQLLCTRKISRRLAFLVKIYKTHYK